MSTKLKLAASREIRPYVYLWNRCNQALIDASSKKELEYLYLYSMLLCAFSIEASLNHLLMRKYPGDWRSFERTHSPDEKLDELAKICNFQVDKGRRPFQTFGEIFDFRNSIVHSKSEKISGEYDYPLEKFIQEDDLPPMPMATWEQKLTSDSAERFHHDARQIIIQLFSNTGFTEDPFNQVYSRTEWEGKP